MPASTQSWRWVLSQQPLFIPVTGPCQANDSLQDECQPVDDVEDEEEYGEWDEEELVYPPVLLGQLGEADLAGGCPLLHLVLEVVLAHDLDVEAVLRGDVALLLEEDGRVPGTEDKGG